MRGVAGSLVCLALGFGLMGAATPGRADPDCPAPAAPCLMALARAELAAIATTDRQRGARDEVHFALALAEAAGGALDAALAEVASIADPVTRNEAQGRVAAEAARLGAFDLAEALALEIGGGRSLEARTTALQAVAVARARASADGVDAGFRTLAAITNPYRRSEAEAHLALARAEAGDSKGAIAAAARIARGYWFHDTQASHQIASGLVVRAREFDHFWLHEALTRIAEIEARVGDAAAALRIAQAIPDHEGRALAQGRIAAALARQGRIPEARSIAAGIDAAYGDRAALIAIARAEAAAGDLAAALTLAQDLQRAYGDETALAAIARDLGAQADAGSSGQGSGDWDRAQTMALQITDPDLRAAALTDLAGQAALAGDLARANDALARLATAPARADALAQITQDLARAGQAGAARQLLAAGPIGRDDPEIALALLLAQAEGGDAMGAQGAVVALPGAMYRALAYAGLARLAHGAPTP